MLDIFIFKETLIKCFPCENRRYNVPWAQSACDFLHIHAERSKIDGVIEVKSEGGRSGTKEADGRQTAGRKRWKPGRIEVWAVKIYR